MSNKNKIHFSLQNSETAFVPVCKMVWSYDCGMLHSDWTEDETKVTCGHCLRQLGKWGYMKPALNLDVYV